MGTTNFANYVLGSAVALIIIIALTVLVYFFVANSKLKKQKAHFSNLHQNLKVGSKIIFCNGIYGKIIKIGKDTVDVEVKSGAVMTISRYAISSILD